MICLTAFFLGFGLGISCGVYAINTAREGS
jgi:hypothetical protein